MAENANIFIPDISGYTEFLTRTEIEHSAQIINELLTVLVESNCTGLVLHEIEGDALLFTRKGEPIPLDRIVNQCTVMFKDFHSRLKAIDRCTCRCSACRTASHLTLKFVVHYGSVSEISVGTFIKASGLDLVVAHRLLKNGIGSHEYILVTENYFGRLGNAVPFTGLEWMNSSAEYPAVGKIDFRYASLKDFKDMVPLPPKAPA